MKWVKKGHQFDAYGKIFKRRNRILIYGAGESGKDVYESIKFLDCVDGFIDRSAEKQIQGFCDLPVYDPAVIFDSYDEKHLIIVAIGTDKHLWRLQIGHKLFLCGYIGGTDFLWYEDFTEILLHIFALYAYDKVYLSSTCVIPSTVCNLNCKGCLNFTSLLNMRKRHIVKPIEQVKHDVDCLFSAIDFTPRLQISGGEPLLYQQFVELVTYIGQNYRHKIGRRFETVLNGSVVPNQAQIEVMREYDVLAIVDNYTDNVAKCRDNRVSILGLLEKHKIRFEDNSVPVWFDLDVGNTDNSFMSEHELVDYFDMCKNPWNYYGDSRIYACNFSNFAINAGILPDDDNNYFVLHGEMTFTEKKQLIEFVLGFNSKGYVDLCKQCSGWSSINTKRIPVAEQIEADE